MLVINRYGHFSMVARLVGNDDLLLAVRRSKEKAVVFIERDRRSVYGNGIHIFLCDRHRLCRTVGLAVLYA